MESQTRFFSAGVIAESNGLGVRFVRRRAVREGWNFRMRGSLMEFEAPADLLARCQAREGSVEVFGKSLTEALWPARTALVRAQIRISALLELERSIAGGEVVESALGQVAELFGSSCSVSTLRRWATAFCENGPEGLLDARPGRSGRKQEAA